VVEDVDIVVESGNAEDVARAKYAEYDVDGSGLIEKDELEVWGMLTNHALDTTKCWVVCCTGSHRRCDGARSRSRNARRSGGVLGCRRKRIYHLGGVQKVVL
jgi:hypothetical protein